MKKSQALMRWLSATALAATVFAVAPQVDAAKNDGPSATIKGSSRVSNIGTTLVTVEGKGFTNLATGTRPPLAGRATGVYVVFGRFDDNWKPSVGAPASARRTVIESQMWALPAASRPFVDPTGTNPNVITMDEKGNFVAKVPVSTLAGTGKYGIAVYPASGAINAAHEFMLELTLASPFNPIVGQKSNIRALAGYAGMDVQPKSKVSAEVRSDSRAVCRVEGRVITALKNGWCVTFISVRTDGKTVTKRVPLTISKK